MNVVGKYLATTERFCLGNEPGGRQCSTHPLVTSVVAYARRVGLLPSSGDLKYLGSTYMLHEDRDEAQPVFQRMHVGTELMLIISTCTVQDDDMLPEF